LSASSTFGKGELKKKKASRVPAGQREIVGRQRRQSKRDKTTNSGLKEELSGRSAASGNRNFLLQEEQYPKLNPFDVYRVTSW